MQAQWDAYPFAQYELQARTSKAYRFRKVQTDCPCGRRGNLKCVAEKCRKCCLNDPGVCKAHAKNMPSQQDCQIRE